MKTERRTTTQIGGLKPSQSPRSVPTLRLQMALSEAQRLERAARIKQLREESPYTQPAIAEAVDVSLRAYQRWEEGGGIEWEHLEKLADLHNVDAVWIHRGTGKGRTPDVIGELSELARLSAAVESLQTEMAALRGELLAELAEVRAAQGAEQSQPGIAERTREAPAE